MQVNGTNLDLAELANRVFDVWVPTVEACFMELRSLLVGAPQGDFRTQKDLKH